MTGQAGLMFVTMEPSQIVEEAFHDWYDSEHVPERAAIPGFRSALRYVCISGWPRYMALYDLDDVAVLHTPAYLAIGHGNVTPWTLHMRPHTRGMIRIEGTQIYPGDAVTLTGDRRGRLAAVRLRGIGPEDDAAAVAALRRRYEAMPALAQLRVFRFSDALGPGLLALIEMRLPIPMADLVPDAAALPRGTVDQFDLYSPWWRRSPLPGVM